MKELKHDIESYIITISRKGHQSAAPQTVTTSRMKPLTHENDTYRLHEPQAPYSGEAGMEGHLLSSAPADITAPLPGIIVDLKVKVGDTVREGDELAVLEAMKMENSIQSPSSGTVRSVNVLTGDTVSEGTVIITLGI